MKWLDRDRWTLPCLLFSPLAWLKLNYLCHAGETEVGGFGISAPGRLLYIEDFVTVRQEATAASVRFSDEAVADLIDDSLDQGLDVQQAARVWIHTHPGSSAQPSGTDEETFARAFGNCDWSVMAIVSRTAKTYARLAFAAGPGGQMEIPVMVDWAAWPAVVEAHGPSLDSLVMDWQQEYETNIQVEPVMPRLAEQTPFEALQDDWRLYWEDRYDCEFAGF